MPAHSEEFPWPSHLGHFDFFDRCMGSHSKVASLEDRGNGYYEITRHNGKILRIFVCECYAFGIAQFREVVTNLGELDVVIINSAWCGYAPDAKRYCRDQNVGLFNIRDFMAALNRNDFWNYLNKDEIEDFEKRGWA